MSSQPETILAHDARPSSAHTTAETARRLELSRERVRQLLEQGMLAGFRIEGQPRGRYVDLSGEGAENDRVLVTVQEAARRFGVTPATIRAWIESGRLEGFQVEGPQAGLF